MPPPHCGGGEALWKRARQSQHRLQGLWLVWQRDAAEARVREIRRQSQSEVLRLEAAKQELERQVEAQRSLVLEHERMHGRDCDRAADVPGGPGPRRADDHIGLHVRGLRRRHELLA